MALYKAPDGSLHDDMDGAALHLLPLGCVPISDEEAAALNPPVAPVIIVSPWQIRKALNATGMRAAVEAAVEVADQVTRDAWEFAQEFRRDNPLIAAIGVAMGKTDEEIDQLFELAASL